MITFLHNLTYTTHPRGTPHAHQLLAGGQRLRQFVSTAREWHRAGAAPAL